MSGMSRALLAFAIVFVSSAVMAQGGPGYEALQAGIQAANQYNLTAYKKNEAILQSLVKTTKDSAQQAMYQGFLQNYPSFDRTKCRPKITNVRVSPLATGATGIDVFAHTWELGNGQSIILPVEEVTVSGGFASTSTSGGVNTAASGVPGGLLGFDPTTFSPASAATGNFAASIGGQHRRPV